MKLGRWFKPYEYHVFLRKKGFFGRLTLCVSCTYSLLCNCITSLNAFLILMIMMHCGLDWVRGGEQMYPRQTTTQRFSYHLPKKGCFDFTFALTK